MSGRPCKPDADLKGLWRMLLGTPFPACGVAEDAESDRNDGAGVRRCAPDSADSSAEAG
jgi:hypothetical protein